MRGVFPEPQQDKPHELIAKKIKKGQVNIIGRDVEEDPLQSESNEEGLMSAGD